MFLQSGKATGVRVLGNAARYIAGTGRTRCLVTSFPLLTVSRLFFPKCDITISYKDA